MDLRLFLRVVSRFRYVVAAGFLLACVLTFLSLFHIGMNGAKPEVTWRDSEVYQSTERLWFTQAGCGQQCYSQTPYRIDKKTGDYVFLPGVASFGQLAQLAQFYVEFATSDTIERLVRKAGPLPGTYTASTVIDRSSPQLTILPFEDIQGLATSPAAAVEVARRVSNALEQYLSYSQQVTNVPEGSRAHIVVSQQARSATLFQSRKLTVPIVVFLSVLIGTLVLAFLLENLFPRPGGGSSESGRVPPRPGEAVGQLEKMPVRLGEASARLEARPPEREEITPAQAAVQAESTGT